MGKCKFSNNWLEQKDANDTVISEWGVKVKDDDYKLNCKWCKFSFHIQNQGFHAILQHSKTQKHTKFNDQFGVQQTRIKLPSASSSSNTDQAVCNSPSTIQIYSLKDKSVITEIIWTLFSVKCNFAFSSSQGIPDLFKYMFPCEESENFTMSPTKIAYYLTDAIAPYCKSEMLEEAHNQYYSFAFDETTNEKSKKELQTTIRFWSNKKEMVTSRHLKTSFLDKANGNSLHKEILKILTEANLSLQKLVMLESDGPNVNKKVWRLLNEEVLGVRSIGLVDIGSCTLHTVHNAFLKALDCLGEDVSDLATSLFHYFHNRPERNGDLTTIQEKLKLPCKHFVQHTSTRWLTLLNASERLIEQWDVIQEYFFKFLPNKPKSPALHTFSYEKIVSFLKKPTMKAEIYFVISSAKMFTRYTELFQKDEPLIHVLSSELELLVTKLITRVCKPDSIKNISFSTTDFNKLLDDPNLLLRKDLIFTEEIKSELAKLKPIDKMEFLKNAQQHYIRGCKYLIEKTPITSKLVKSLECLHPQKLNAKSSARDISYIAKCLPVPVSIDQITDEWKLLALESNLPVTENVSTFWNTVFKRKTLSGNQKYPEVSKVVRVGLILYHGNADIERRFSVSSYVLTEYKTSMTERTLDAVMMIKDHLRFYKHVFEVPIDKKLITSARLAYKAHQQFLEEQRLLKEKQEKEQKEKEKIEKEVEEKKKLLKRSREEIENNEKFLEAIEHEMKIKSDAGSSLICEARKKLKIAIEKNDLSQVTVAKVMLDGAQNLQEEISKKEKEKNKLKKRVDKKRTSLITSFCNTKV